MKVCLQLGEGHLNEAEAEAEAEADADAEVGGVWRKVREPAPHIPQSYSLVVMCGEFVANDDSEELQFRSENFWT